MQENTVRPHLPRSTDTGELWRVSSQKTMFVDVQLINVSSIKVRVLDNGGRSGPLYRSCRRVLSVVLQCVG